MASLMDVAQWQAFVSEGTRTGKLATTRRDGRPHVVPIWFVLDGTDFVFNTGEDTQARRAAALGDGDRRYMGADRAEEFGRRNAVATELLVRLHADHVLAMLDIAD
jgi:pyridoxamine 5'-phosphate oxidase-like protein